MKLETIEQKKDFKLHAFPTFKPLEKHPNSISGTRQKLDKIKEKGGFLFKRNGDTFFFKATEIPLGTPHKMNQMLKGDWYAVYLIPEEFRI